MPNCKWLEQGNIHWCSSGVDWPDSGELDICSGERGCGYCPRKGFGDATRLRIHVYSVHVPNKPGLTVLNVPKSTINRSRSRSHSTDPKKSQNARGRSRGAGGRFSREPSADHHQDDEEDAPRTRGRKRQRSDTPAPSKRTTRQRQRTGSISTVTAGLNLDPESDLSERDDHQLESREDEEDDDEDDEEIIPPKPKLKLILKSSKTTAPKKDLHVRVAPTAKGRKPKKRAGNQAVTSDGEDVDDLERQLAQIQREQRLVRLDIHEAKVQDKLKNLKRAKRNTSE